MPIFSLGDGDEPQRNALGQSQFLTQLIGEAVARHCGAEHRQEEQAGGGPFSSGDKGTNAAIAGTMACLHSERGGWFGGTRQSGKAGHRGRFESPAARSW